HGPRRERVHVGRVVTTLARRVVTTLARLAGRGLARGALVWSIGTPLVGRIATTLVGLAGRGPAGHGVSTGLLHTGNPREGERNARAHAVSRSATRVPTQSTSAIVMA